MLRKHYSQLYFKSVNQYDDANGTIDEAKSLNNTEGVS